MDYKVKDIAQKCGMSTRAVYEYAEKIGIKKQGGRWRFTPEQAEQILSHYGCSLVDEPQGTESAEFAESAEQSAENAENAEQSAENDAENAENAEQSAENDAENAEFAAEFAESADGVKAAIQALSKQLEEKDKQIQELNDKLRVEQEHTEKLMNQVSGLIGNLSLLNAADKRDLLNQGDSQEQPEVIEVKQEPEPQIQEPEPRSMTRWEHLRAFFTGK